MSSLPYRRDIDGLRALAILPVVFYHLGLGGFTGGYVGVDVFLVISGYLITSIIRRDRQAGRFSFVDFWARRARRILPALFVMMAVSLAAGWFLMEPRDYEQLGRAVRYQTMFASNILFWKQDGYFDAASNSSRYCIPGRCRWKSSSTFSSSTAGRGLRAPAALAARHPPRAPGAIAGGQRLGG